MSDWLSLIAGIICGLAGLGLLAQVDFPVIRNGGLAAVAAGFELVLAAALLSAALGLVTRHWHRPPGG